MDLVRDILAAIGALALFWILLVAGLATAISIEDRRRRRRQALEARPLPANVISLEDYARRAS